MEVYRIFYYMYTKKKYELPAARGRHLEDRVDQNYHQTKDCLEKEICESEVQGIFFESISFCSTSLL